MREGQQARNCRQVATFLRLCRGHECFHEIERIKKGILLYHEKHGVPPGRKQGDATAYLGYSTTWNAVAEWLRSKGHPSLCKLAAALGLNTRMASHTIRAIKNGVRKYYRQHGRPPSQKAGDATEYVGYEAKWSAVNAWLRAHGHGSLSLLSKKMGAHPMPGLHLRMIEEGVRKFVDKHGRAPKYYEGDATEFFGKPVSWMMVTQWLNANGHGRLSVLCDKLGHETRSRDICTEEILERGLDSYVEKHGRAPSKNSGDASPYLGLNLTWNAILWWMRKRGLGTLTHFYNSRQPGYTIDLIRRSIFQFVTKFDRAPTKSSGRAFEFTGRLESWNTVDRWLKNNGYGSLVLVCDDLHVATSVERKRELIVEYARSLVEKGCHTSDARIVQRGVSLLAKYGASGRAP